MKKKKITILVIILSIIIIAAILVASYFLDPARQLYVEGQSLMKNADYSASIDKFQMLVDRFPDSEYAKEANTSLLAECHYKYGLSLENDQNYCDAIEKYQIVLTYPESSFGYSSKRTMMDCYYQWGQDLENQNNYAEALGKYQAIMEINEYYFTLKESQEETIPQCYYEWVTYLVANNEYEEAIQKYSLIQNDYEFSVFASSDRANVLKDVPDDVLFSWATKFRNENSYCSAIRLFEVILQHYPWSEYFPQAEEAKIETEIAKIAEQDHGFLPPSYPIGPQELGGDVEYIISNDTDYILTVLLSGPSIRSVTISAGGTQTITLKPGTYETAAKVDDPSVIPYYGTDTLIGDTQYEVSFYIRTTWG